MRRLFLLVVILVGLIGVLARAECGCASQEPGLPPCYRAFWACEAVLFKLIVPGEFVAASGTSQGPLITGWRIESLDGTRVFENLFPDVPMGAWYQMAWNQRDSSGDPVPAGYYRVVVETTSAGEFAGYLEVVQRPSLFLCSSACLCSRVCSPPCGTPYVLIERDRSSSCGCSVSFVVNPGCGCGCR